MNAPELHVVFGGGQMRAVTGRASDFYGPGGTGTYFGDALWPNALRKGEALEPVNVETPHTYHYTRRARPRPSRGRGGITSAGMSGGAGRRARRAAHRVACAP